MTSTSDTQERSPIRNRARLLVESLGRAFRTSIYYPVGHVVLDQSASKCVLQIRELAGTAARPTIRLEVGEKNLRLVDHDLDLESQPVTEFHRLLDELGVVALEFDKTLTHKHFLRFMRALLGWRRKVENTRQLIGFELDELPETIRVEQREYREREHVGPEDEKRLEEVLGSLGRQGLSDRQLNICRELLEGLSTRARTEDRPIRGYPNATWKDVEQLLYRIVTTGFSELDDHFDENSEKEIDILASIFSSLARDIDDTASKQAIEILVSHLSGKRKKWRSPTPGAVPAKKRKRSRPGSEKTVPLTTRQHGESVSLLQRFVRENTIPLKVLEKMHCIDRSEDLSITLLMLRDENLLQVEEGLRFRLQGVLSTRLTPRELEVLIGGVRSALLDEQEDGRDLLETVLETLAEKGGEEPPGRLEFLVRLWSSMPFKLHFQLWPWLVNAMLIEGLEGNEEWYYELLEIVSHLPLDKMRQLKGALDRQEVMIEGRLAPVVFRAGFVHAYRFFGFLLETGIGEKIAAQVVESCRENPQDRVMQLTAPILQLQQREHYEFLRKYLLEYDPERESVPVRTEAGRLLLNALNGLAEEDLEEEWVVEAIDGLAEWALDGTRELFDRIVNEKKMGIVPVWPKNCRKAAEEGLKKGWKNSAKDLL